MSASTPHDARNASQMTSVGSHNGFRYESITASEHSRLHMGIVYHYTNINYHIGLPSVKHDAPPSSSDRLLLPYCPSPPPKLVANYQEAHRSLPVGTGTELEVKPAGFFTKGRVFSMLSPQPGDNNKIVLRLGRRVKLYHHSEEGTPKLQRFVVILEGQPGCYALLIRTYGGQGVAKQGVKKSEHAVVYTGSSRSAPRPQACEMPRQGEAGMLSTAIRVDVDCRDYALDPRSRIDFGSKVLVQHSARVNGFGVVNRASMEALQHQFGMVWAALANAAFGGTVISHVNKRVIVGQDHNVEEDCIDEDDDDDEEEESDPE